ncbi:pantetheinase precursor [Pelomyxa schiedti]|nr:pantetheinase precursor [Pelomyxa schiedti]
MKNSSCIVLLPLILLGILLPICGSVRVSHNDDGGTYYNAGGAVMMPRGSKENPASANIRLNLDLYGEFMDQVGGKVDLFVFPESSMGLLQFPDDRDQMLPYCETLPPLPIDGTVVPCTDPHYAGDDHVQTREVSCLAAKYSSIIVVNMCEVQYCNPANDSNCPSDGRYQWTTDAVFSETGAILAKYHKSHLAGEAQFFEQPPVPEVVTFTSWFGVTFGIQICYDGNFLEPTQSTWNMGVRNMIWNMYMNDEVPVWSNNMLQCGVANFWESNLVVSNGLSSGTGIYSGGMPLATVGPLPLGNVTTAVIASVPLMPFAYEMPPEKPQIIDIVSKDPAASVSNHRDGSHSILSDLELSDDIETCYFAQLKVPCVSFTAEPGFSGTFSLPVTSKLFGTTWCNGEASVYSLVNSRNATYAFGGVMFSVPGDPKTPTGISRAACQLLWCPQYPQCKPVCPEDDSECAYHPPAIFQSFSVTAKFPSSYTSDKTLMLGFAGGEAGDPLTNNELIISLNKDPTQPQTVTLRQPVYQPLLSAGIEAEQEWFTYSPNK